MKRSMITALSLIAVCSLSVTISQSKTMANKAGLEKTVNTFFGFVKANNTDKIRSYYTADYTFTGPDGNIFNEASDITVRVYGNTGMATGVASTTTPSGTTQKARFIQVWTWQGGRWRLAASQVTNVE
jgi:ketosteroid isomerase-like protein